MNVLMITGPSALNVSRLAVPKAKPGEIVVWTAFVSICGADVHLHARQSFYLEHGFPKYPFIFGHEYIGTVSAMSEGVTSVTIGSRVVGHCMVACQRCGNCQRERRHLCRNLKEVRASGTERFGMPEDGIDEATDRALANPYRNPRGQKRDAVRQGKNTEQKSGNLAYEKPLYQISRACSGYASPENRL